MRKILLPLICVGLASCAFSQSATPPVSALNTLLVSGGPTRDYNQYAIESNARYLDKLTSGATSKHVLFADGLKTTRSIVTQESVPNANIQEVFAWIFDIDPPDDRTVYKVPTLAKIDGPSNQKSVTENLKWLTEQASNGQKSLLYFTGHGSEGRKSLNPSGEGGPYATDTQNTNYNLWGGGDYSVRDMAGALQNWPAKTPLVLVMVQCHAGGFANLIFEGGDPSKPLLDRDFAGFFAATGDRMASGCTPEVDETDYQDFTTHFFAALSGTGRDGKKVNSADYDHNGAVSMLEALAWTELKDMSIDVPVCTSDTYLRTAFPQKDMGWASTTYSTLLKSAAPWQKAILEGLSKELGLKGEARIKSGMNKVKSAKNASDDENPTAAKAIDNPQTAKAFFELEKQLKTRFPDLKASPRSARFQKAKPAALKYIASRPNELGVLSKALKVWYRTSEIDVGEIREAQALRFVRTCRTLTLEQQLKKEGTPEQKAAFVRLRTSESRNPLR